MPGLVAMNGLAQHTVQRTPYQRSRCHQLGSLKAKSNLERFTCSTRAACSSNGSSGMPQRHLISGALIKPALCRSGQRFTRRNRGQEVSTNVWPFDLAWDVDNQTLASNLFASSIIPYAGFLYHLNKSGKAPPLVLFGFRFLLVFVLATIIAGIYAKLHYNSILANIDWLHGSAESFLTLTNLFIVLGLRQAIKAAHEQNAAKREASSVASNPQESEGAAK